MDEERERGRVAGLSVRRAKRVEHVRSMIEPLEQARRELPVRDNGERSLTDYARWLNQHDYKTVAGKVWRAQTVDRLFDITGLVDEAEAVFYRQSAILTWKINQQIDVEASRAELANMMAERDRNIAEARQLGRALRGLDDAADLQRDLG